MRFDFAGVRQALPDKLVPSLSTAFAVGGVSLAALMVGYVVLFGGSQSVADTEARTTTVAVAGPMFKPVVATPVVEERVDAPSRTGNNAVLPPPQDARALTRAVQTALKDAGCYRGKVNGSWTAQTSAAMDEFTMRVNARLPVDRPDPVLLALLETHDGVSCASADASSAVVQNARPVVTREAALSSTADAVAPARAEQLSYSESEWERREIENAHPTTASVNAEAKATPYGAEAVPVPVVAPPKKAVTRERRTRNARKYRKKPSFSREVRRSFRSIQRSMNRLF